MTPKQHWFDQGIIDCKFIQVLQVYNSLNRSRDYKLYRNRNVSKETKRAKLLLC